MRISLVTLFILTNSIGLAADQSPAEKSISKAIAVLEANRDKLSDPIEDR
jgi:hypothetical protein